MDGFKVPHDIPQDLLLIQEFIGVPNPPPKLQEEDEIDSSDSETVSEDEIAADLITGATDEDNCTKTVEKILEPSDSSSETDSSLDEDPDSEPEDADHTSRNNNLQDQDDDEDPVPNANSGTYFQTKHEIAETDIVIPQVDRIDPDEVLEKVGDVMNIIDRVVIIKGNPSNMLNRGSDRALDSDTLLVFDDRTVMGYVYETFGPTAQPLYQVKFNSTFPLDLERVKVGREVFHVPAKSRFVFVSQIKALKGSDASNVHDEEPAADELEFSDDEAEAAYRSHLKRKRGESRSRSVVSSRESTPNPSQMRDQELADEMYLSRNAYDAHGPYDVDFAGPSRPSRPPPIPYDDPYGDDYTAPVAEPSSISLASSLDSKPSLGRSSGSGRGYDRGEHHGRGRGRGRGRDRDRGGQRDRGRGRRGGSGYRSSQQHVDTPTEFDDSRGRTTRSLSPTSLAIARATGQVAYNGSQQQQSFSPMYPDAHGNGSSWGYNHVQPQAQFQQHQYGYMQQPYHLQQAHMQAPLVQPHINPRFASAFGIAINAMQQLNQIPSTVQQQNSLQNTTTHPTVGATDSPSLTPTDNNLPGPRSSFHWTDEWTVHHGNSSSYPGGETKNIGQ